VWIWLLSLTDFEITDRNLHPTFRRSDLLPSSRNARATISGFRGYYYVDDENKTASGSVSATSSFAQRYQRSAKPSSTCRYICFLCSLCSPILLPVALSTFDDGRGWKESFRARIPRGLRRWKDRSDSAAVGVVGDLSPWPNSSSTSRTLELFALWVVRR